jgi:hypothetical protein
MTLFVSEDSQFEAAALQRAVDADRDDGPERRLPRGSGVGLVIALWIAIGAIFLVASLAITVVR